MQIAKILCPVDFSDPSRRALDYAMAFARWYQSEVTVLTVAPVLNPATVLPFGSPMVLDPIVLAEPERQKIKDELNRFIEGERAAGVAVATRVTQGDAAGEILGAVRTLAPDLLVMGTHGRSGFNRLLVGSVAEKVLRQASCPVLSVPPHAPDALPVGPVLFRRILCAIDFSDASLRALAYALGFAGHADARVVALHVVEAPAVDYLDAGQFVDIAGIRQRAEAYLHERLAETRGDRAGAPDVTEMVGIGRPYREILRVAREESVDLVVMGVHGRGAVDLALFGSTTAQVVRQATCPVLTVRTA